MTTLGLLLSLSACIWVSDDEVDAREVELTDADGDGYVATTWGGDDCDDTDGSVSPGVDEVPYDGVDNDCDDGTPDEDVDGDGFDSDVDCADDDASIYPGAAELCDDVDQDCDDVADNGVQLTVYTDGDGDGYGDPDSETQACTLESGYSDNGEDCDDEDPALSPLAEEICDGVDNDCNELTDDEDTPVDPQTWYADLDGDGYGDAASSVTACEQPANHTPGSGDCEDGDSTVHPDGLETLGDFTDGDCDGDDDTFSFDAVDTRDSAYVRGPRLAYTESGGDELLHLGWSALEFDDGSGVLNDGMLVATWDAEDPLAGEIDFLSQGSGGSIGLQGEAADFFAAESMFVWTRVFDGAGGRELWIDAYDRTAGSWSAVSWQQAGLGTTFEDLQLAVSRDDKVHVVGCSTRGGGIETAELSMGALLAGDTNQAKHDFEGTEAYTRCDYDETVYLDYYFVTGQITPPMQTYDFVGANLVLQSTWEALGYEYTDIEFTWEFGYWTRTLPLRYEDGAGWLQLYAYWYEDSTPEANVSSVWVSVASPVTQSDVAPAPDGDVVSCGIHEDGSLALYTAAPLTSAAIDDWPQPLPGSVADDCAVVVTKDSVAAVTIREGDDIWIGFVGLP